jgi:hypothetical protein
VSKGGLDGAERHPAGDSGLGRRHLHGLYDSSRLFQDRYRLLQDFHDRRIDARAAVLLVEAEDGAPQTFADSREIVWYGLRRTGGIILVSAGDCAQQRGCILHTPRDGADVIERLGERKDAVAADPAPGGLQSDAAIRNRRKAD